MDAKHFDRLARVLSEASPRRGLLGLLASLPVLGGLVALLDLDELDAKGRRKRRKKRHKHGKGRHRSKSKNKKKCKPRSLAQTCSGKCGPVTNNCQKTVDCGSCDCDPPCETCFTCQGEVGQPGSCVPQSAGTPCGAATCEAGAVTPQGSCDGSGACVPGAPVSCDPYLLCDGDTCATTCGDDNDCVAGAFCNAAHHCVGDGDDGQPCVHGGQCASGFCVDGVCCDTACNGDCEACALENHVGACWPEPNRTACGSGAICCSGACVECCQSDDCSGTEPVCVSNTCAPCSADPEECPSDTCCNAASGACTDACPASAPICVERTCTICSVDDPCPTGCCASDGSCQPGGSDTACGSTGQTCEICEGAEACTAGNCAVPCGQGGVCLVFATSTLQQGNFGGLTQADDICQNLAEDAGLPGAYMAWLSDGTGSPSTRFVQSTGPYWRVDGVTVANNWADLTDGSLRAVINRTETGAEVPFDANRNVWTNTATTGAIFGGQDCENWTTNSNSAEGGMAGIASATNVQWTSALGFDCDFNYRLYCFQQS